MKKPFVALQLYTVRDFLEKDAPGTLRKIKEMGYDYVELAGTYGMEFRDFGLSAISAHVSYDEIIADTEKTVAEYKARGCEYIAIPSMLEERLPGGADYENTIKAIKHFCAVCKALNIIPLYHNHDYEFKKLPSGEFKLDKLFEDIPEIFTEIDTGWVTAVGQNPESYISKYAGRCPIIHLKDTQQVSDGKFEDRPVGQGSQNMPGIIKTAQQSGAVGFIAELDNAVGKTSLEAAAESREYLKSLGF